ncbi:MAG TPA: VWA domain-containing protein [Thermoanaerobaculia bacterium]|nr:VWA domain-containing protein [Thermoanaerobaculia bacterium]
MKALIAALMILAMQSPYGEVIEVRLHNVDVIVTDAEGRHVGGLREEDFEVLEDGKPQAITNFAEYAAKVETGRPGVTAAERQSTPDAQAQVPPQRKFVVFIDDLTIHPYTRRKFTKSVSELVARTIRDGDLVSVVRPTTPDKVALSFTGDRTAINAEIQAAMDASRFRTDSALAKEKREAAARCGDGGVTLSSRRQLARCRAALMRERVEQRLGNLRALVSTLAQEEGRKVVVVVTESLPVRPGEELFRLLYPAGSGPKAVPASFNEALVTRTFDFLDLSNVVAEIARSASAGGITIYCLQPDLNIPLGAPGDVESQGVSIADVQFTPQAPQTGGIGTDVVSGSFAAVTTALDALRSTEETMDILTEKTGGKWFRGDSRVDDAFRQVELDVSSYYSMAYRAEGSLDRPHRIAVRVKNRPELNVRARNEVVRRSIRNEVTERVVAGLVDRTPQNDLGIAVRAGDVERKSRRDAAAKVDVIVPLEKLTFLRDGDTHRAKFTVHYAVSGERTDFVSGVEPEQIVEIPAAEFEDARSKTWRYTLTMNMRKGPHRVGVGVLDGTSQEWGVATVEVNTQ